VIKRSESNGVADKKPLYNIGDGRITGISPTYSFFI
jgi:hypothetical protein